jgi:hypothetical protein
MKKLDERKPSAGRPIILDSWSALRRLFAPLPRTISKLSDVRMPIACIFATASIVLILVISPV